MMIVVILQPKIADNNAIEKLVVIILQLKVISSDILKKCLINFLQKNQLDSFVKTLIDSQDINA